MKDFLIKLLIAALGLTQTEAEAEVAKVESDPEAQKSLLDQHKTKIDALKQTELDNGYKKGTKEVKFAFEKDIKEKFGITSDKKGLELVEELVQTKTAGKDSPESITEDVVKKHPVYLNLENRLKTEKADVEKEWKAKLAETEKTYAKKETFKTVSEKALAEFEALKPILSEKPEIAAKQKARIIRELEGKDFQVDENGILVLGEDGKRKEDGHGNALKFGSFVKSIADDLGFEFKVADDRDSAGGDNNKQDKTGGEGGKKFTGTLPTNTQDYYNIVFDPAVPAEAKEEVKAYWSEQNK